MRLCIGLVSASRRLELEVSRQGSVEQLAVELGRMKLGRVPEVAQRLAREARLDQLDLQGGDRCVLITAPPPDAHASLSPRDERLTLRLTSGTFEKMLVGKSEWVIGRGGDNSSVDIDLRALTPPELHSYLSRRCLLLRFDATTQTWAAVRVGQTRLFVDEFELDAAPIPLNTAHWLRFYRATDVSQPLITLALSVQVADGAQPAQERQTVSIWIGGEQPSCWLNTSESLTVEEVMTALARYLRVSLTDAAGLYRLRLLAPSLKLVALPLKEGDSLYTRE
jgi:hypothetical protein